MAATGASAARSGRGDGGCALAAAVRRRVVFRYARHGRAIDASLERRVADTQLPALAVLAVLALLAVLAVLAMLAMLVVLEVLALEKHDERGDLTLASKELMGRRDACRF